MSDSSSATNLATTGTTTQTTLALRDFRGVVSKAATALQAASRQTLDLSVGSVLRALLEANATIALWMQWVALQLLATTRAATATGADLDSWMLDFGVVRLQSSPAAGQVLFARTLPALAAAVPPGTIVRTAETGVRYAVLADANHPAWTGSAYVLPASVASVLLPVRALVAGSAGNLQAGAALLLSGAIAGVDQVGNPTPIQGGLDAESDASLRARFNLFLDSRSRATALAIRYAVLSLRQGMRCVIAESQDTAGSFVAGSVVVTIDDGTGAASAGLVSDAAAAIELVRPVGMTCAVRAARPVQADLVIRCLMDGDSVAAGAAVSDAVTRWIAAQPIGAVLPQSRVVALTHAAVPGIDEVLSVTINGQAADLTAGADGVLRPGLVMLVQG